MQITSIKIFLRNSFNNKLKAFASVVFSDVFVVKNIKIIEGEQGLFVAMPSIENKGPCPKCNHKNIVHSKYCSDCGSELPFTSGKDDKRDLVYPVRQFFRKYLEVKILEAYKLETNKNAKDRAVPKD